MCGVDVALGPAGVAACCPLGEVPPAGGVITCPPFAIPPAAVAPAFGSVVVDAGGPAGLLEDLPTPGESGGS